MGKTRKSLSQAEVWDDSALLQSWNDALTEYKLYHSIHGRGERIEDVVKEDGLQAEDMNITEDNLLEAAAGMQTNGIPSEIPEDGELEEEPEIAQASLKKHLKEHMKGPSTIESEHKQRPAEASTAVGQQAMPGMPYAVTNGVKDEALKNLMMSWYYAGYYTGLYEGQQQIQSHLSK